MTSSIKKLARLGSGPIRATPANPKRLKSAFGSESADALLKLMGLKNGFYAFESALHVLSCDGSSQEHDIVQWNSTDLWRNEYADITEGCVFFAEDVFGNQFCLRGNQVFTFDAETGALEPVTDSMDAWAQRILDDYELLTGYRLARDWQELNGAIPIGARLVPITPFMMGGDYAVGNLHAVEAVRGMRYRASIAMQIRNSPDGTTVKLKVVE
jgi:hypothetical protein